MKPIFTFFPLAVLLIGTARQGFGQTATGSITGRVTDSSGAAVAGVEVTSLNPAKGMTIKTVTDEQGLYRLLYLAPATYDLTFTHAGFRTLQRKDLVLRSNDVLPVDIEMTIGSVLWRTSR